jgi:hypothetical protein
MLSRRHPLAPFAAILLLATQYSLFAALPARAQDATKPTTAPSAQDVLDRQLTERLTNAVMAGSYTVGKGQPKADKYTIVSVRRLKDDNWLINARIEFGGKDVTIPMVLPIKWAGDTPVISVTNIGFPGLGTYTARVMIYGDQYAGTWESAGGNRHGGLMWGRIEKAPAAAATQPAAATRPAK